MIEDTKATEDLFQHFRQVAFGDVQAAAALTLAHTMRQTRSEPAPADVLTVAEAAEAIKVSGKLIYGLCASGRLRHLRIGAGRGTIRVQRADLAKIIAEATQEPDNGITLFRQHVTKPNSRQARRREPA